jgi:hypothetical protein
MSLNRHSRQNTLSTNNRQFLRPDQLRSTIR